MHLIKRLLKQLTIRKRAFRLGCELRDQHGFIFTGSPKQLNTCRTLIRLNRIQNGLPPFAYAVGDIGDVWVTRDALVSFGNIKSKR